MPICKAKIFDFKEGGEFTNDDGVLVKYKASNRAYVHIDGFEFPFLVRVSSGTGDAFPKNTEGTVEVDISVKNDRLVVVQGQFKSNLPNSAAALDAMKSTINPSVNNTPQTSSKISSPL